MQGLAISVAARPRDLWFPQLYCFRISLNYESIPAIKANNAPDLRIHYVLFPSRYSEISEFTSFQDHNEPKMVPRIEMNVFLLVIRE